MHNQKKKGKKKIQTNVKWRWEKHYISTKTNPELKPNRRIPKNQKSNKNRIQKKGKKNIITKISWFFFAIDLTTKEEEENVEICKEKKTKTKKLKSKATHSHKPTKFHEKQKQPKKKKLKSKATHSHKLTKFHEQLKRIEREQYIEIMQSKKHVLITSK